MKSTLPFAISVTAIALGLVFSGISRRTAGATDAPETTQRLSSEVSQSNRRTLVTTPDPTLSRPHETPSVIPGMFGRLSLLSKGTGRPGTSCTQSQPPSGSHAAGEVIPPPGLSAARYTIQASPNRFSEYTYQTPQPAAWVDMGDLVTPDPIRDAALQAEAARLISILPTGFSGTSLQSDAVLRQEIVGASDHWFRQRYGSWLWMQHHIQAHQLAAAAQAAGK